MKKQAELKVFLQGIEESGYEQTYDVGESVCERFALVYEDKRISSIEVVDEKTQKTIEAEKEEREWKKDVLVSFPMPQGGASITVRYAPSEDRVRLTFDMSAIQAELAEIPSYFYSAMDDANGDTHDLSENKTYFYDAGDDITVVLRMKRDRNVKLCLDGKEYAPEEKKEKSIDGRKVYEYTFGQTDDFDPACHKRTPIRLKTHSVVIFLK